MIEMELPVYYYENIKSGHSTAANNQQHAYGWALDFSYLWTMLR
jgi:prolyl oligopeptidase